MIRILVVDDHELVRNGLCHMLSDEAGFEVIGEASNGEQAVALSRELVPDIVLMDVHMPGMGGLDATKRLRRFNDEIKVIALTVCEEEPFPSRLLKAGAVGYLTKGCDFPEMTKAIRLVHSGQRYISPDIAQQLALKSYGDQANLSPFEALSERELQVMLMVVNCHKVQDISDQLSLSPKTVNSYRYRIFDKLQISSDVELTLLAVRHDMIHEGAIK